MLCIRTMRRTNYVQAQHRKAGGNSYAVIQLTVTFGKGAGPIVGTAMPLNSALSKASR